MFINNKLSVCCVGFFIGAIGFFPLIVGANGDKPADHVHQANDCQRCHPDKGKISDFIQKSSKECKGCHGKKTDLIKRTPNQRKSSFRKSELGEFMSHKNNVSVMDGMRYPLYSARSRLGDLPNSMVSIPKGAFIRGTNNRLPDEGPEHQIILSQFFIDIYEVTNLQYKRFIDETHRRSPLHFRNRTFPDGKADHPVTYVSWNDANSYCAWAGKRLPSDKEWEKAGRGSDGKIFPWGNEFDMNKANTPVKWKALEQLGDTTPVGAFLDGKSVYGVFDLTGNVWEWTDSWYQPYPGNNTDSENYGKRYKVLKGGSWFDCSFYKCGLSAPLYNRSFFSPRTKNDTFGFRCASSKKIVNKEFK